MDILTCDVKLFAFNFVFSKKIVYEQAKINFLLILRSVIEFSYIRSWLYLQDGLILTYLFGALNGRTNATNRQNDPRTDGQTKFFTKFFRRLRYLETYEFFFLILRTKKDEPYTYATFKVLRGSNNKWVPNLKRNSWICRYLHKCINII